MSPPVRDSIRPVWNTPWMGNGGGINKLDAGVFGGEEKEKSSVESDLGKGGWNV